MKNEVNKINKDENAIKRHIKELDKDIEIKLKESNHVITKDIYELMLVKDSLQKELKPNSDKTKEHIKRVETIEKEMREKEREESERERLLEVDTEYEEIYKQQYDKFLNMLFEYQKEYEIGNKATRFLINKYEELNKTKSKGIPRRIATQKVNDMLREFNYEKKGVSLKRKIKLDELTSEQNILQKYIDRKGKKYSLGEDNLKNLNKDVMNVYNINKNLISISNDNELVNVITNGLGLDNDSVINNKKYYIIPFFYFDFDYNGDEVVNDIFIHTKSRYSINEILLICKSKVKIGKITKTNTFTVESFELSNSLTQQSLDNFIQLLSNYTTNEIIKNRAIYLIEHGDNNETKK
jgi:hypothetical protein